jgi:hypothetical protein
MVYMAGYFFSLQEVGDLVQDLLVDGDEPALFESLGQMLCRLQLQHQLLQYMRKICLFDELGSEIQASIFLEVSPPDMLYGAKYVQWLNLLNLVAGR